MRKRSVGWGLRALVAFAAAVAFGAGVAPVWAASDPDRGAAAQLLVLINADRASAGLAPLSASTVAVEVAEAWSAHMADTDELAHNDDWFTEASRARAGAGIVGENVAYNADIADAHRRLMNSPSHRANILDGRFHQVGIGVVQGSTGSYWITEDFLQVKNAPAVTDTPPPPPVDPTAPPPAPAPAPPAATPPASAPAAAAAPAPTTDASRTVPGSTPPAVASQSDAAAAAGHGPLEAAEVEAGDQPAELAAGAQSRPTGAPAPGRTRTPVVLAAGVATLLLVLTTRRLKHVLAG